MADPILQARSAALQNRIVADARSMPDLIAAAKAADPALAEQLTGKALLYSRTVWGTPIVMLITWGASRYGLGWDVETCSAVAGAITWCAVVALRYVTRAPIAGIVTVPPVQIPAAA
jgi:hypothetical protein